MHATDPGQRMAGGSGRASERTAEGRWEGTSRWKRGWEQYKTNVAEDVWAGASVGVLLVPQAMAYATLAQLPPRMGLCTGCVPPLAYAVLGTSKDVAVGPVAVMSLLTAHAMKKYADPVLEGENYQAYAINLAMAVGALQIGMGWVRTGTLFEWVKQALLSGFTTGAAITVAASQLPSLLGYPAGKGDHVVGMITSAFQGWKNVRWWTVVQSASWMIMLLGCRSLATKWKRAKRLRSAGPLLLCMVATLWIWGSGTPANSPSIVGKIDAGIPDLTVARISLERLAKVAPHAFGMSLVGFLESMAVAKILVKGSDTQLDSNRELMALGSSNVLGSIFSSFPATGSFSRSVLNHQAGAKTRAAGLFSALFVLLVMSAFAPLLRFLPKNALAAIIAVAVSKLINFHEPYTLWLTNRTDLSMWAVTFAAVVFLGTEYGMGVLVLSSLCIGLYELVRPPVYRLEGLLNEQALRMVNGEDDEKLDERVTVVKCDGPLIFLNATFVSKQLVRLVAEKAAADDATHGRARCEFVLLDMSAIFAVDACGAEVLGRVLDHYSRQRVRFGILRPRTRVKKLLQDSGFLSRLGEDSCF